MSNDLVSEKKPSTPLKEKTSRNYLIHMTNDSGSEKTESPPIEEEAAEETTQSPHFEDDSESEFMKKPSQPTVCPLHAKSDTSVLDIQLQRPQAIDAMQALSLALAKIIEGGGCTKCLIKEVARTVTIYAKELCAAKRNGEWTREEKKALKREAKATFQEVKGEVKETWRGKD